MSRRIVHRGSFCAKGMSCNHYIKDEDGLWRLRLADGTLVEYDNWVRTDDFVNEQLKSGEWIELRDNETISMSR